MTRFWDIDENKLKKNPTRNVQGVSERIRQLVDDYEYI
jgi:hypothetical protein